MSKFKEKIEKTLKQLKNDKKTVLILAVALCCAFVTAFGNFSSPKTKKDSNSGNVAQYNRDSQIENIENALESKVSSLISNVDGIGNVSVSVSLESTGTIHYAQDINEKKENDSIFKDSEYIYTEGTAGQPDGLIVRIDAPVIRGVAVVCDGGESAVIKNEITSLISSLFNIGSDKIYVGKGGLNK